MNWNIFKRKRKTPTFTKEMFEKFSGTTLLMYVTPEFRKEFDKATDDEIKRQLNGTIKK